LAEDLNAFRRERITVDLIFGIRHLIEDWEYGKE
jgi:hypothetical protein